jgi:hypothetical protein
LIIVSAVTSGVGCGELANRTIRLRSEWRDQD